MKKTMKKILCSLLVVVMCLTAAPLDSFVGIEWPNINLGEWFSGTASATTEYVEGYYTYTVTDDKATIVDVDTSISGDITIPATLGGYSVTTIGYEAFYDCTSLTSVTISDSVTAIGHAAFANCYSLTSVTIPDSVTTIGDHAFLFCDSLTSVTIPDSVTTIGDYAFAYCDSLTSITIPDSVTTIGDHAFAHCDSLTSVTIPDSVTTIGDDAFAHCDSLTSVTIPDSVTTIGDDAFYHCDSLTSVTIPDSVTTIGVEAFADCDSLTSIVVDINNSAYSNDSRGVLFNKNKTMLIQYPTGNTGTSYTIPDSVTAIGHEAFAGCTSLTSVTIPDSVTTIGVGAFAGCTSLTSVTIPDSVTTIGVEAFADCDSLTSVTIPDSVTTIGDYAFYNCDSLTSVTIPKSVTSIGEWAFFDFTNLKDVYYQGSEEQWKKITIGSFNDCLTSATIHYNSSGPVSEIKYSQTHVVDNYQAKNDSYESEYFSNMVVAMDGSDGTSDLCIPGLTKEDNLVPQGITYYLEKNWILISAYSKNENTPSVIFALDKSTGDYVAEFEIHKSNGDSFIGHLGGIAASSNNLYLTNGKEISYIPLSEFNVEKGTSKTVKIEDSYTTYLGSDGASVSYVSISDGVLYAGNFYNESKDYNTPANPYFNSIAFGYKLSGSNSTEEWNKYVAKAKVPDVQFYIPDEINEIQCATVKDGKLYLSASYGRQNDSRLYVVSVSNVQQQTFDYADIKYAGLPMMEGMTFINDDLYAIFESGAYFYREKDSSNIAKNPTDVVWKISGLDVNIYNMGEETYSFKNFGDLHSSRGHCFGMSMTSSGYYTKELDVSDVGLEAVNVVYSLNKTSAVKKPICYYQNIQGSYALKATVAGGSYYKYEIYDIKSDWDDVVNYVKNHEYDNKGVLQIGFRKDGRGGHAINFLRYEEVNGQPRIYAYDNNFPDIETYFYKDSNGKILQAPNSTFSGEIDCIALRSVEKYYDIVGDYDSRKTWFADKDMISITSTNVYPVDGNIKMGERVVFELTEDVDKIVITPLVDNATFTYMDVVYSFGEINEDTYAEFTLSTSEKDNPEFEIINEPHEHIYDETKTEPTCTETGSITYTCYCGETYTETINANGHTDSEWIIDKDSTCSAEGSKHIECTVCEEVLKTEAIAKLPHNYSSVIKEVTCETGGYTTYTCTCGETYTGDKTPAKGHDYAEGVCKNCGDSKVDDCSCKCHKTGLISKLIWKISIFFNKLLRKNKVCSCGIYHY